MYIAIRYNRELRFQCPMSHFRARFPKEGQAGGRPSATWPTIDCEEQWRVASGEKTESSGECRESPTSRYLDWEAWEMVKMIRRLARTRL